MVEANRAGAQRRPGTALLVVQIAVTFGVFALSALPPARGLMLVVPLGGSATAALAAGARIVDRGPIPGSLVVSADRATLMPHLLRHGAVAVSARAFGCGGDAA